jgi:glyoxylase-like metal-dependent hydrolase (beta-lactamase superfamily II)
MMKRRLVWLFVVTVAVGGCEQLSPERQLIHDAAEALGGVEAVEAVATLRIEGSGNNFRLGQNPTPSAPLPMAAVESYVVEADLSNHRMRWEIASANFAGRVNTAVTAMDADVAFDVGQDGARRAGSRVARERHLEFYHHPLTLLQAALAETAEEMPPPVGNLRQEAGNDVVDVTTADGSELTLHIDTESRQVVRIASMAYNPNLGDIETATTFRDYADAGGLMLPGAITRTIDRQPVRFLRVNHTVGADIGDLAAPADVASAGEPDPPAANVTDEELAEGVWLLAGQSHHSVLVELPEQAVLVEAPQHDARTLAAIARARELVPDKPLSHVVNTHHHFDHSGGIRAAVAEGLSVITHDTNRALFEELAARPHTLAADHLAQQPAELMLETVSGDDTLELGEGRDTMQVFRMGDNPHADGALVVYLPAERMLIQADMFIPGVGGEFAETAAALLRAIEDRNLRVEQLVPIHGAVLPLSALEEAVEAGGN